MSSRSKWLVLLATGFVISCDNTGMDDTAHVHDSVSINLQQSADDLNKNNPGRFTHMKRPPGVNFYSVKWDTNSSGVVKVNHGEHSFIIKSVISVSGNDDPNFPTENIFEWHVNAGLSDDAFIGHDPARTIFFSLLKNIRKVGWTQYHGLGHARLLGKDVLHYSMNNSFLYGLDPEYLPTLEEWMAIEDGARWRFYANHAYLDVSLWRDRSKNDVQREGAYFIQFTLTDENEQFRKILGSAKRSRWKEQLPLELKRLRAEREAKEKEFKIDGINIDDTYRDPPVPGR